MPTITVYVSSQLLDKLRALGEAEGLSVGRTVSRLLSEAAGTDVRPPGRPLSDAGAERRRPLAQRLSDALTDEWRTPVDLGGQLGVSSRAAFQELMLMKARGEVEGPHVIALNLPPGFRRRQSA